MNYREETTAANAEKEAYLAGLEALIAERQRAAARTREGYARDILREPERYRRELREMLGWPLTEERGAPPVPTVRLLSEEEGCRTFRLGFEILPGVTLSGLYFEQREEGAHPLVLVQHGGLGTPEHISGFLFGGDTTNYNRMLERVLALGVHAFCPQLLLWSADRYGVPSPRVAVDARLKRVGSSVTAVELFGLFRILDYFEAQPSVSSFGMVGLSYGGFYTLLTAALDTRIRAAVSCSFFNTRDRYPWPDWCWQGSAFRFDDAEMAALVFPRPLTIAIGTEDKTFAAVGGEESFAGLSALCREVGTDWVELIEFEGTHEFLRDDAPLHRMRQALK